MRVEVLVGLQPTVIERATRVVVYGDDGTPVSATAEWQPGVINFGDADDGEGFTALLAGLGIDRTTVVTRFRPKVNY